MTSHSRDPDADLLRDDDEYDDDHLAVHPHDPYSSNTRWRHEESSAYRHHAPRQPRAAETKAGTHDLADFLNSSRIAPDDIPHESNAASAAATPHKHMPLMINGQPSEAVARAQADSNAAGAHGAGAAPHNHPKDGKTIACGPLLNYRRMQGTFWVGSVLVVTTGGGKTQPFVPTLTLRRVGEARADATTNGTQHGTSDSVGATSGATEVQGFCLYSESRNTFWRFDLQCEMEASEVKWEYTLPEMRYISKKKPQRNSFYVPAITESMRIMFHSCNGFSVGTDEDAWSGPALWNDVMRRHAEVPFHVMIGGGDQIYNDGIRVHGPLRDWTAIGNPKKRREFPFPEELRAECDDYYLNNYIRWYSTEPFASANGQIPQVNIWDDHDIIDGFGSYVNEFMKCDVFRGIGGCAHKYYMLFQHHVPPPPSTYTSDAPQTTLETPDSETAPVDPVQLADTFVAAPIVESNYVIGPKPGPYVAEHSRNIFAKLGARIALLGIDARTERTRHQVNYPETYELIFGRLREELQNAQMSGTPFRHVILLLGIPIAYPRLTWLENIFSSPILGPVKFANRRFGLGGGLFNHFDGSVDLLDDLDDHYTARTHKKERNWMIESLQTICQQYSVRLTILGGDVHLAALGRFYSNPSLNIPCENDHRYMVNVISSAIVNKPPPQAIANLLSRRNKIHHLNSDTDETLLKLFNKDPGDSTKTAAHNQVTMPSRNFAMITENSPNNPPPPSSSSLPPTTNDQEQFQHPQHLQPPNANNNNLRPATATTNGHSAASTTNGGLAKTHTHASDKSTSTKKSRHRRRHHHNVDGRLPVSTGETGCGTTHKAAHDAEHGCGNDGGLDICIRVEIDQHDPQGRTESYGLTVPALITNVGGDGGDAAPL